MTIVHRLLNEPALLVAVAVALLNVFGVAPETQDQVTTILETAVLLLAGVVVRQTVTGPANAARLREIAHAERIGD